MLTILFLIALMLILLPVTFRWRTQQPQATGRISRCQALGSILLVVWFVVALRSCHGFPLAAKNMPRRWGPIHNTIVLHQGDTPEVARGGEALAAVARLGTPEVREYDVPLKRPFYFSDNNHPETIFSDLALKKGDRLEITVSGAKVKCIADCPTYVFPLVGPDGGDTITDIKDPDKIGSFAFPGERQGCVVGQIGSGVKFDDAGIPFVVGKHPDPFAIGSGPVVIQVPENGAKLFLMLNLPWMAKSWNDVDDAFWHVTIRKYNP